MAHRALERSSEGFRPDIQGLRAIAVLAVVLYHAHLPGLTGGFVGVDIFFVISGYLICGLLARELTATGRIDLPGFWLKRARRLLPNAALTLLAVLIGTALLQPGYQFLPVSRGVMAAALSFANLHFAARDVDYFADDAHPSPVLHFWSLSVEEQFYIAWPLMLALMALLFRRTAAKNAIWLLAFVWVTSFIAAMIAVRFSMPMAFYHCELRAWQLATGGLLAALAPRLATVPVRWRVAAGWLGVAGMTAAMLTFNDTIAYPGFWSLIPTLSAAGVLGAPRGKGSPSSLLALAPLRWIGDRSYSLYLWHWPALVLLPSMMPGSELAVPSALAVAAVVAAATYQWVEAPIRDMRLELSPRWPGFAVAVASVAVVLMGTHLLAKPVWHRDKVLTALEKAVKTASADKGENAKSRCSRKFEDSDQPLCAFGDVGASRTAVLLGDSHASQWFEAIDKVAKANGWRLLAWTKSACPISEVSIWYKRLRSRYWACETWRDGVLARLTGAERPQKVFLASSLSSANYVLDPVGGAVLAKDEGAIAWRDGLTATILKLKAAAVEPIVIADTPQAGPQFADCLATGKGTACDRRRSDAFPAYRPDIEASRLAGAALIDLSDRLCGPKTCSAMRDGLVVYRDPSHLAPHFALGLADAFQPFLPPPQLADEDIAVSSIDQSGAKDLQVTP